MPEVSRSTRKSERRKETKRRGARKMRVSSESCEVGSDGELGLAVAKENFRGISARRRYGK